MGCGTSTATPAAARTVKVWHFKQGDFTFPEMTHEPLKKRLEDRWDFGVAVSGGGSRSGSAMLGYMRALTAFGLMDKVRYLSVLSGGCWGTASWMFLPREYGEAELLGDDRRMGVLGRLMVECEMTDEVFVHLLKGQGAKSYSKACGDVFLENHHLNFARYLCVDSEHLKDILERNPHLSHDDFWVGRDDRPMYIVGGSIIRKDSQPRYAPVELTPFYSGVRATFQGDDEAGLPKLGGGYVETFGYDAVPDKDESVETSTIKVRNTKGDEPVSISDLIGVTSGAALDILHKFGFPVNPFAHMRSVTPNGDAVKSLPHADGGFTDNTGLAALLARKCTNCLVFLNGDAKITPSRGPIETDWIHANVIPLFEKLPWNKNSFYKDARMDENVCLKAIDPDKDAVEEIYSTFTKTNALAEPAILNAEYDVLDNTHLGISGGWRVKITWVYLDDEWFRASDVITKKEKVLLDSTEDKFKRFPFYATVLENAPYLFALTPEQVQVMARSTCWSLVKGMEDIAKHLLPNADVATIVRDRDDFLARKSINAKEGRVDAATWENKGLEKYVENFGQVNLEEKLPLDYVPDIKSSMTGKLNLKVQTLGLMTLFNIGTMKLKDRPTHATGVQGGGIFTVVDNPSFPAHSLFIPGKIFKVRVRHANLSSKDDDAALDTRSMSIKFGDSPDDAPLDLVMNSGECCPFWNSPSVFAFTKGMAGDEEGLRDFFSGSPLAYEAVITSLRREPTSFTKVSYHSQIVYELHFDVRGKREKRYAKFRCVPSDLDKTKRQPPEESGMPSELDQQSPWIQKRRDTDASPTYLRDEYKEKLKSGVVQYTLQMSLWHEEPSRSTTMELFNIGDTRAWDFEGINHWLDVGTLDISTLHTDQMAFDTRYIPNRLPKDHSITLPEAVSPEDYRSIAHMRGAIYPIVQKIRSALGSAKSSAESVPYLVTVATGDYFSAGTDANVRISVGGTVKRSEWKSLGTSLKNDFERGSSDTFVIEMEDIGEPKVLHVTHDGKGVLPKWYLSHVRVENLKHSLVGTFPCYQWIDGGEEVVVPCSSSNLPQHDEGVALEQRKVNVAKYKQLYPIKKWGEDDPLLPASVDISEHDELPEEEQFDSAKNKDFVVGAALGIANLKLQTWIDNLDDWDTLDDFQDIFITLDRPITAADPTSRWKTDRDVGRQYLNGPHPNVIYRVDGKMPHKFGVTEEMMRGVLPEGTTLQGEIDNGRIFMVDCDVLEGIGHKDGRFFAVAMALFHAWKGDLSIVAVQLGQHYDAEECPVWTKKDGEYAWLLAKMYFRSSDAQVHQMGSHLLSTHLVQEGFALALNRNFPRHHPIYKLVWPHTRYTMAINTIGRASLISQGGIADRFLSADHMALLAKQYGQWRYEKTLLPKQIKARGVDSEEVLPRYGYRDDGLKLWAIIERLVRGILSLAYKSDDDVTGDFELQGFYADLSDFIPNRGIPEKPTNLDDVVELVTSIIFRASCEHAAQNFSQFDHYGMVPNLPTCMMLPPPKASDKAKIDEAVVMKFLPNRALSADAISIAYNLSQFSEQDEFLGTVPELFWSGEQTAVIADYKRELRQLNSAINKRNKTWEVPYTTLMPSRVPNSIAI